MRQFSHVGRQRVGLVLGCFLMLVISITACSGPAEGSTMAPGSMTEQQEEGRALFKTYCASCHATRPDVVVVGPSLAGIAERASGRVDGDDAAAYIDRSIIAPEEYIVEGFQDLMPKSFADTLTVEQRQALVAYLMTLR